MATRVPFTAHFPRGLGQARIQARRRPRATAVVWPAGVVALLALPGCIETRTNLDPAEIQVAPAERLSPGQVVAIATAAHVVRAQQGRLAQERAASNTIRQHAERMTDENEDLLGELSRLLPSVAIVPRDHPVAAQLQRGNVQTLQDLLEVQGEAFNRAYIERQVALDRWYLAMLDHALLPSSSDPRLRQLLSRVRAATAAQLDAAQQIAATL